MNKNKTDIKKIILAIVCIFKIALTNAQLQTFQWAKSIGEVNNERVKGIALDASGNVYTIGFFQNTVDFDPGPGTFNLTAHAFPFEDIFILKLDAAGNFVWAKNIGGAALGNYSIAVDASENVYTAGTFSGTIDFDPGPSIVNLTTTGNSHAFILKLDTAGNFVWVKEMGGDYGTSILATAIDKSGNIYTTGYFNGTADFDPGADMFNLSVPYGWVNVFISKLDAFGNFVWAKKVGGEVYNFATSIAIDAASNAYITGYFAGTADFDPGPEIFNLITAGRKDIFILKLDATGNFMWAKKMGGKDDDFVSSIVIDGSSNVYTTGYFIGTADFDPGVGVANLISDTVGYEEIFVSKLDASGNFVWAKKMGGPSNDRSYFITLDAAANVYTTGSFIGLADFDPGVGIFNLQASDMDVFISKLDTSGNFVWAKNITGGGYDEGNAIAVDISGNVYTAGVFAKTADFDMGSGIFNLTSAGGNDIFVHKMSSEPLEIKKNSNPGNIAFYPNPTNGLINIVVAAPIKNINIEIYNSTGILVYKQTSINKHNTIEFANQNNGLYFVKVMNDNKTIATQKIIKQ